ncbi:MAG: response regulator [Polyangia bacterium]
MEPQPPLETILVVDDTPLNLQLIEAQLSVAGYAVTCASSGEEALSLFERYTPDLIILDIMMPRIDGFETFRRLRQLPGGNETPVVFLTAAKDLDTHKTALDLGADDFLCKPINRTELLVRVRSLLRIRRLHAELRHGNELLRAQRDALIRVQQQKEKLSAFVVHDLNNRLTTIVGLSDLMLDGGGLPASTRESAQLIADAADSIQRMVMNLLDISRSEDGEMVLRLQEIDLAELLQQVCQRQQVRARQRRQTLHLQAGPIGRKLRIDAELLTRLLDNLIDNAIKYAPADTRIELAARLVPGQGVLEIRVSDEGPGIPSAQRERIFEKYVQLDPHQDARWAGRGLGLAFCRLVAEAHGGRIFVEANTPRGSTFCLQLPLPSSQTIETESGPV